MTPSPTKRRIAVWLLLGLLVGTAWVWTLRQQAQRQYEAAAQQLTASRELAAHIQQARDQPTLAAEAQLAPSELAQRLAHTAAESGIAAEAIARVWPQPERRLGDSPYTTKPTEIHLNGITLAQTLELLTRLENDTTLSPPMDVTALRIVAPRIASNNTLDNAPETWSVDATLSQTLYRPIESNR